tara:strand:+ start:3556 stop:4818 length:1263 start_codon:yes stop_codon:yes gene_type:complete
MATNRDLLKEAIADAKAVKEMAIANAKTALEEAFTPRLKEMLSAKIQEMDEEDSKSMEEMKYEEDDTTMEEGMYEEDDVVKEDESIEEEGFGKAMADGDEGFSDMEEKALDEVDLEELLAELEEEEKEDLNEAEEEEEVEDEEESEEEEGEPLDLEDMTDEDLKKMIEDVIADMVASGELEGGDAEGEEEEGEEMEMSDEEEEVDLTELLREIEEEMKDEEMNEEKEEVEESVLFGTDSAPHEVAGMIAAMIPFVSAATGIAVAAIKSKLSKAKSAKEVVDIAKDLKSDVKKKDDVSEEMAELQAENKSLKSDLNEAVKETNATNLLNAKLLYTNKIFKSKNLNESQKVKVLSSFDKANTTKEAKLVYETLSEGLKTKKSTIKENLGRASKATTIPTTKKPIVESNDVFARMQKLAGIIK